MRWSSVAFAATMIISSFMCCAHGRTARATPYPKVSQRGGAMAQCRRERPLAVHTILDGDPNGDSEGIKKTTFSQNCLVRPGLPVDDRCQSWRHPRGKSRTHPAAAREIWRSDSPGRVQSPSRRPVTHPGHPLSAHAESGPALGPHPESDPINEPRAEWR
jgi:hypothetical protein